MKVNIYRWHIYLTTFTTQQRRYGTSTAFMLMTIVDFDFPATPHPHPDVSAAP